jgi:hypothetical protein
MKLIDVVNIDRNIARLLKKIESAEKTGHMALARKYRQQIAELECSAERALFDDGDSWEE